ncbi:MAG: hypothetical protein AAFQ22_06170 [Pseudomonadota bacterium]
MTNSKMIRSMKTFGLACVAVTLAACGGSQDNAPRSLPPAYVDALESTPILATQGSSQDLSEINEAIAPFGLALSADNLDQTDTGAMRLTNAVLGLADGDGITLRAAELRLWDADFDLLAAYLSGEATDRSGTVIARLEADGLAVEGLERLYDPMFEEMNSRLENMQPETGSDLPPQDFSIESYVLEADAFVLSGFEIHTLETLGQVSEELDEGATALRHAAAWARTLSLDVIALTGATTSFEMSQFGETSQFSYNAEFIGYRGLNRGDLAAADTLGVTGVFDFQFPDFAQSFETPGSVPVMMSFPAEFNGASSTVRDLRLSRVLEAIVDGELFPHTETDAVSFGLWQVEDMNYTLDGATFLELTSMDVDMTEGHWIFPKMARLDIDGLVYDYAAYAPLFMDAIPIDDPAWEGVPEQILEILERYNLLGPKADFDAVWNWSPEAGDISLTFEQDTEGFGVFSFDASGAIPAYSDWAPKLPTDGSELDDAAQDELTRLFEDEAVFEGLRMTLRDEGGLDRYFGATVEVAQVLPEDIPQVAAFRTYDEETLRSMLGGFLLMGAGQANREVPGFSAWAQAFADFIKEGGTLSMAFEPETPLTGLRMAEIDAEYGADPPPEVIIEALGIRVEHTAND